METVTLVDRIDGRLRLARAWVETVAFVGRIEGLRLARAWVETVALVDRIDGRFRLARALGGAEPCVSKSYE